MSGVTRRVKSLENKSEFIVSLVPFLTGHLAEKIPHSLSPRGDLSPLFLSDLTFAINLCSSTFSLNSRFSVFSGSKGKIHETRAYFSSCSRGKHVGPPQGNFLSRNFSALSHPSIAKKISTHQVFLIFLSLVLDPLHLHPKNNDVTFKVDSAFK